MIRLQNPMGRPQLKAGCSRMRAVSRICLLAGLAILLARSATAQQPTVRFVLQDGARVSDVTTVVARATCADNCDIAKVEFSVDGKLRYTDTSTPYSFDWDTLQDTEGQHTLTATVYDTAGHTATATITVVVDNELSKGADYHADAALAALKQGNMDLAVNYARRALKIDPGNLKAARAMAAIDRKRGEISKAIAVLEKANIPENEVDARADLVGLYIAAARDAPSTEDFLTYAAKAIDQYKRMLAAKEAQLTAAQQGKKSPIAAGDTEFYAHQWEEAIKQYQKCGESLDAPLECANRLALAYVRAGRLRAAELLLHTLDRSHRADAVTNAVQAYLLVRNHAMDDARALVKEGASGGALAPTLVLAAIEITQQNTKQAARLLERANALAPDVPEVQLLRAYVLPDPIDGDHAILKALELDPMAAEAYAERGFRILLSTDKNRFASADALFAFALKQDKWCLCAMMGQALSLLWQHRAAEAEPIVKEITRMDPNGADVHMLRAFYFQEADQTAYITAELDAARKCDADRWGDAMVPDPRDLVSRIFNYRPALTLSPASLYPAPGTP
ncbi:MAG: Ig-like domain-containing protein [Chthonomonadales bacterium]